MPIVAYLPRVLRQPARTLVGLTGDPGAMTFGVGQLGGDLTSGERVER